MEQLNIYDAKMHFSHWIEAVHEGKSFIIAKAGRPVAQLVPLKKAPYAKFKFGALKGKIKLAENFDAPLSKRLMQLFEKDEDV